MLLLAAACHRNRFLGPGAPSPSVALVSGPALAASAVWVLERSGASPPDTAITFSAAAGRTIVIRHGPPDNSVFAILEFGKPETPKDSAKVAQDSARAATASRPVDSVRVRLAPSPGRYGLEIRSDGALGAHIRLTFSYAMHFMMPSDAAEKYRTPAGFEQNVVPAHVLPDGKLKFVASERPAADMIRFTITEPGVWLLAAPR